VRLPGWPGAVGIGGGGTGLRKHAGLMGGWAGRLLAVALCLGVGGCDQPVKLAQTPTLHRMGLGFPAEEVPVALRTVDPEILYVTDRRPDLEDGRVTGYGHARSDSMAFGVARVRFGEFDSWPALIARADATEGRRQSLITEGYDERLRFPETPLPYVVQNGRPIVEPGAAGAYRSAIAEFQRAVADRLRTAERKEVIIFIHGFNNDLDDGLATVASLWHFSGRFGVPVSYSWPAGNKGLTAYIKDRESGEFSIYHLKEFLRALAAVPGLEKVHIVAHSRGADVTTTALRELAIFEMGAGRDLRRTLKIETLILAAPDLDFGVVRQRLAAENAASSVGQVYIYINPRDGALGFAQALATGTRIGRLSPDDLTEKDWSELAQARNVHFINVEDAGGRIGHAYFRDNPAVLSDVVLILRTGALPGSDLRPLEPVRGQYWSLHRNYPGPRILATRRMNSDR
jgi:pimeloyl-ACP methyl ester carboxylesterase